VGRRTFEAAPSAFRVPGMKTIVLSHALRHRDYPEVSIVGEKCEEALATLRAKKSGMDIRLCGGGLLFPSLLDAGWTRWRSLSARYSSAEGFRCSHRRPNK
jgi:dihydrofolate reductase